MRCLFNKEWDVTGFDPSSYMAETEKFEIPNSKFETNSNDPNVNDQNCHPPLFIDESPMVMFWEQKLSSFQASQHPGLPALSGILITNKS
jgi:hypothetical protein